MSASCRLTGQFGKLLQLALGVIAFISLIFKRRMESPRRPWKVWFFDTSKQGSAAVMVHVLNIGISYYMMKHDGDSEDECTWYFTNVLLDSTFGLFLMYWFIKLLTYIVQTWRLSKLRSGDYGSPPRVQTWIIQLVVYNTLIIVEKLVVSSLLLISFIQSVGHSILTPLRKLSPKLELVFALLIFPLFINIMWFWILDDFIMSAEFKHSQKRFGRRKSTKTVYSIGSERLVDSSDEEQHFVLTGPEDMTLQGTPLESIGVVARTPQSAVIDE
eukprot:m.341601 g.341601  ORF g.341601 m.341601 type:complete len:272 (-) comp20250_c0_seq1:137-952(-)